MMMHVIILIVTILYFGLYSNGGDVYPSYSLFYDPIKSLEWSDDRALAYITTVRLFDYDHYIFQYRRYPCQYFYTDDIQMNYNNETINECIYNTTTSDYEYSFQLHLDSHHVEPYILRNLAIQCKYMNCSLSLLTMKYLSIDWNLYGRNNNFNCSFDPNQHYHIYVSPYSLTEWITLRCKTFSACSHSKQNLERSLITNIQLVYGSSYEMETPYCSLEKNIAYVIETNFAKTNHLLEQLVETIQRGFGKPNEREQAHMREYVEHKWVQNETNLTTNKTNILGQVQGMFQTIK